MRRVALLNAPLIPETLDVILSCVRDVDPVMRKLVYTAILGPSTSQAYSIHSQCMTLEQRDFVVRNGLGDVEDAVRVAAGKMLQAWFDAGYTDKRQELATKSPVQALITFLKLFDVTGEGASTAVNALNTLLLSRPDIVSCVVITGT